MALAHSTPLYIILYDVFYMKAKVWMPCLCKVGRWLWITTVTLHAITIQSIGGGFNTDMSNSSKVTVVIFLMLNICDNNRWVINVYSIGYNKVVYLFFRNREAGDDLAYRYGR